MSEVERSDALPCLSRLPSYLNLHHRVAQPNLVACCLVTATLGPRTKIIVQPLGELTCIAWRTDHNSSPDDLPTASPASVPTATAQVRSSASSQPSVARDRLARPTRKQRTHQPGHNRVLDNFIVVIVIITVVPQHRIASTLLHFKAAPLISIAPHVSIIRQSAHGLLARWPSLPGRLRHGGCTQGDMCSKWFRIL